VPEPELAGLEAAELARRVELTAAQLAVEQLDAVAGGVREHAQVHHLAKGALGLGAVAGGMAQRRQFCGRLSFDVRS
jgi:predicted thioesterase